MSDIILWQIFWFFYGIVITQLWHTRSYIVCTFGKCSDFRCYLHLSSGFVKILNLKFIISILSPKSFLTYTNNKATCFLSYFLVYPVKICLCFSRKLLENLSAVSLSVKNLLNAQTREKVLRLFRSTHILWCSTSLYASALSHFFSL